MATILEEERETAQASPVRMEVTDGLAVITLNDPARPVNVISEALLREMSGLIDRLENGEAGVRAAVIVSEKKGTWIAGADIEEFKHFKTPADAEAASRAGQELLDRLERLRIPVVAAIDGAALGGGLETALACTYRIASDSPKTRLGLPEVQLGIIPGAGGTARLPRLIGLRASLDLMLTAKKLDARRAMKAGIVDEVVPQSILLDIAKRQAIALADKKVQPRAARRSGSPDRMENLLPMRKLIFSKARQGVMEKTHGVYPAPLRLLKVVEAGLDKDVLQAQEYEARAFGELAVTPEARSLVHVYFTSTAAKNDVGLGEDVKPKDVDQIAIVGAGFMGAGIAAASAESGIRVRLKDVKPEAAAKGLRTARDSLIKRAKRKKAKRYEITALIDRVQPTTVYTGFHASDVVVEAVFEDLALKHRVIKEIEEAAGEGVVVGSNTSTIPITRLAEASSRPDHVIGLHFFSPVEKMPLVEIITHAGTADWVTATAHAYAKKIGKTPIVVHDSPGFYVNRILSPYMAEAALLLQEGVRMEALDEAMTDWGFPVGPVTLYDEVGLDVAQKAGKIMAEAFAERMGNPPTVLDKMVEAGRLGRKNGKGFYRFGDDGKKAGPDETVYAVFGSPAKKEMPAVEIQERLALVMVNEAVRTLEEGVLRSARDGDVGAVFGIGFPAFRGGPFWYVDRTGAQNVLDRLRALEQRFGARYRPAKMLEEMARDGKLFFPDNE
jgi:3-hydroxyacyl-CoA dehydrogenase/enoyl-CoA hydratase/3-hydroxybutyryl-CoA epimerase